MKKPLHISLILCATFFIGSCSQDILDSPLIEESPYENFDEPIGLEPGINTLSKEDAELVALIFKNQSQRSKSSDAVVKNVVTINGKDGSPALYAVNLNQGYIMVPATKALPPILAIIDDGTYSNDEEPFGRDVLISQMIDEIDYWKGKEPNPEYEIAWLSFTKRESIDFTPRSREEPGTDVWYVQSDIMYELYLQGYECYRITKFEEDQEIVPEAVLQRFKDRARFEDNHWEMEDEDMMYKTAFVAVKDFRNGGHSSSSYLLKTHWHQDNPYNNSLSTDRPLGCVTVAVGQIMKYYNYPTNFNWADMPDEQEIDLSRPESTTSKFLKKIHDDLGIGMGTSASIDDAEKVLKNYGYSVKKVDHRYGNYVKYPTYCRGWDPNNKKGHAWVCDGEANIYSGIIYELYILDCAYYPKFKFYKIDEELKQSSYTLYHMNWGWADIDYPKHSPSGVKRYRDGFFYDSSMNVNLSQGYYQLNSDRKDLIITRP